MIELSIKFTKERKRLWEKAPMEKLVLQRTEKTDKEGP